MKTNWEEWRKRNIENQLSVMRERLRPGQVVKVTEEADGLTGVMTRDGAGYQNSKGELVIPCIYEDVKCFSEGLASVMNREFKEGFINTKGEVVIPFEWAECTNFKEGRAVVSSFEGLSGYIDREGEMVSPCKWKDAQAFSEGYAMVKGDNGLFGFIDLKGKQVVPCRFKDVMPFDDGLACVLDSGCCGRWGMIDKTGKFVIKPQWHFIHPFCEGLACVSWGKKKGFIDMTEKEVIPLIYDDANSFSGGVAPVKYKKKWGFINKEGELVIPFVWDDVCAWEGVDHKPKYFLDGTIWVTDYYKNRFRIDKEGNILEKKNGPFSRKDINSYTINVSDKKMPMKMPRNMPKELPENKEVSSLIAEISPKYYDRDYLERLFKLMFFDGFYIKKSSPQRHLFEDSGLYGFVNEYGQPVLPAQWKWAYGFDEGLAVVMDDSEKKGYINTKGEIVLPLQWKLASWFKYGVALVQNDEELWALIDRLGNFIVPFQKDKYPAINYVQWSVWLIEETDGHVVKRTDITDYVSQCVDPEKALEQDWFVPQPIEDTDIVIPKSVHPYYARMCWYGYRMEELVELTRQVAKAGYCITRVRWY